MNLWTVAIMWFGGKQIADGDMPIGDLTAFLTYIVQILFSVMMATIMFVMVPRAAASAERIQAVLDTPPTIADPAWPGGPCQRGGRLEFRDVDFRYPRAEEPVIRDISLQRRAGGDRGHRRSTGSGKTTLINLIPRFYDVTAGSVLVDGVDVRDILKALWPRIGLVPQKPFLFRGTIGQEHPLRQGRRPARPRSGRGLDTAQATEFIAEIAEQLEAAGLPGRHQRLRRPETAPGDSPGPGSAGPSTSSTTASRPSTSRPTRGCGPRSSRKWPAPR